MAIQEGDERRKFWIDYVNEDMLKREVNVKKTVNTVEWKRKT